MHLPLSSYGFFLSLIFSLCACAGEGERFAEHEIRTAQAIDWYDVEHIFSAECAGCHDDPPKLGAPQALRTYEEVLPWLTRIQVRSLEVGDMPPGGLRTEGAKTLLSQWIEQGAPKDLDGDEDHRKRAGEDIAEEMNAGQVQPLTPSWIDDIFPLFEIYCNTCHNSPPTGGAPFPLKNFEQAIPYLDRFQERVIERQDMPPGGIHRMGHLQAIQTWIASGGPR